MLKYLCPTPAALHREAGVHNELMGVKPSTALYFCFYFVK